MNTIRPYNLGVGHSKVLENLERMANIEVLKLFGGLEGVRLSEKSEFFESDDYNMVLNVDFVNKREDEHNLGNGLGVSYRAPTKAINKDALELSLCRKELIEGRYPVLSISDATYLLLRKAYAETSIEPRFRNLDLSFRDGANVEGCSRDGGYDARVIVPVRFRFN